MRVFKEVYGEFKFFLAHCDLRRSLLSFKRCRVASCACMRNYPRLSTMFVARMQQMSDVLLSPVPDPQQPGGSKWRMMPCCGQRQMNTNPRWEAGSRGLVGGS